VLGNLIGVGLIVHPPRHLQPVQRLPADGLRDPPPPGAVLHARGRGGHRSPDSGGASAGRPRGPSWPRWTGRPRGVDVLSGMRQGEGLPRSNCRVWRCGSARLTAVGRF
jgi:hypothetical protein